MPHVVLRVDAACRLLCQYNYIDVLSCRRQFAASVFNQARKTIINAETAVVIAGTAVVNAETAVMNAGTAVMNAGTAAINAGTAV